MMVRKNPTTELSDDITTKSEVGNHNHRNNSMFLVLVIAIGSLTTATMLSVPTIIMMINAQASSSDDSGTDKQMGICVVGAGGPCNGGDNNNLAR
jgi:hypothetical protein